MTTNGKPKFITKRVTVNPKQVTTVTAAFLGKNKKSPDYAKYEALYQRRNDEPVAEGFKESLRIMGRLIHPPVITKIGASLFTVVGNKRMNAAKELAWTEVTADQMPFDIDLVRDIKVMENEQRKEVSFLDRLDNIMAYLKLDENFKPRGLSFEETGKRFLQANGKSYNHMVIRNLAQLAVFGPDWLKKAITEDNISYTEAQKLVSENVIKSKNGTAKLNEEGLKKAYEKWSETAVTTKGGRKIQDHAGTDTPSGKAKLLKRKLLEYWAYNESVPVIFRMLLQGILQDITLETMRSGSKDSKGNEILGWAVEPPKKTKKSKKAKADDEEEVSEEELEELEEVEEVEVEDEEEEEEYEDEEEEEEEDEYEEEEEEEEEVKPTRRRK